jgi:hypothetical protein
MAITRLLLFVMAGHSRPKDGVLSHAYVPGMTKVDCVPQCDAEHAPG